MLLSNYRVMERLGEGGMGVAYVGRHEALGHRVVVKVLPPDLSSNRDLVQRFFNEAQAATAIRSPGIAQVFDFGTTAHGCAYFVMELLDGHSLAARLTQRRSDHGECCRLGRQIANVLQAAHAAGIIHRDLKPDNLFLVPDPEVIGGERVKVLDFGIAKLAGEARASGVKTITNLAMATPHYMAPEQCRNASAADARSDIYSLGCILFEIACGRRPFDLDNIGDVVTAQLYAAPPSPHQLSPDVPIELSALISNMLAKRADARPQTMAAVSHALDDILHATGGAGRPGRGSAPPPRMLSQPLARHSPARATSQPPSPWSSSGAGATPEVVPQILPHSIALSPASAVRTRTPHAPLRLRFVLGGFLAASAAAAAILAVLSIRAPAATGRISYDDIAAQRQTALAAAGAAGVAPPAPTPPAPPAEPSLAAAGMTVTPIDTSASTAALDAECQGYQTDRKWDALASCAEQLKPLAAPRAVELATRAAEEARSAPHVTAATAALRARKLRQARKELDQIWPSSIDYPSVRRSYYLAEGQEIDALVTQLDGIKDPGCTAYHQAITTARMASPPRVVAEAVGRVGCVPAPCDADALADTAGQQFVAGQLPEALASYEAAYACRPAATLLQNELVVTCNLHDEAKARSLWQRMPPEGRKPALATCVRNGIAEAALDEP